jgi:Asp-tRNA(Asn)/Glu-tRNA(Gln) amidotransferase A subunit family amidase
VIPLAVSLDHVGPIARAVADAAVILQAIAGFDRKDSSSTEVPVPDCLSMLREQAPRSRIGVPRTFFFDDLDPEIDSAMKQALAVLTTLSAEVRDIELAFPTDRTLQSAESYAYHANFVARSPELYQPETLRRIRSGENISAADVIERRRELEQARQEIGKIFEEVDLLVTPTTPIPAPTLAELKQNPDLLRPREILLLRNTRPINVWGLPAISVPCGFTSAGLPIGLQIIGPYWGEAKVLQLAHAYEQATAWHKRQPGLAD